MAKKSYDETSVIRTISKKSVHVDSINKTIEVLKDNTDVGKGTWGKIDYLCKVHGYHYIITSTIRTNFSKRKSKSNDEDNNINVKTAKRERKLNMAAMTKAAMKRNSK